MFVSNAGTYGDNLLLSHRLGWDLAILLMTAAVGRDRTDGACEARLRECWSSSGWKGGAAWDTGMDGDGHVGRVGCRYDAVCLRCRRG